MPCPGDDTLDGFAAGRLEATERRRVEEHLDTCDQCLRIASELIRSLREDSRSAVREPETPALVARYRLLEVLGEGGMGTVYRAHDPQLDREVALKVLRRERVVDASSRARMLREARTMAKLPHPNIVTVFEAGEAEGATFIAMELVRGTTLADWLAEERRSPEEILRRFLLAGRALAAAHAAGVVHRDFKPANVLLDRDGRVLVTDFGIASSNDRAPASAPLAIVTTPTAITETGAIVGTPAYMSPEQYESAKVDAKSDQFSFAVALHGALFGVPPFQGESFEERRTAVLEGRRSPIDAAARRRVTDSVYQALVRALSRDPAARYPTLSAFLDELAPKARDRTVPLRVALAALLTTCAVLAVAGLLRRTPAIAARSAPLASDPVVTTLLTLPEPKTSSAEALALYRDGLVAMHDGVNTSFKSFQAATEKDPRFAAAYLRYALANVSWKGPDNHESVLDAYRHAVEGRDRLSLRDRALVDALEPGLLRQPPEWGRSETRLRALVEADEKDETLRVALAQVLLLEDKMSDADAMLRAASALDPHDAMVLALQSEIRAARGDLSGVRTTATACLAASPRATLCLGDLEAVSSIEGKCSELEAVTQRVVTTTPEDPWSYIALLEAELALGKPEDALIATEQRLLAHLGPGLRPWASIHYPTLRAILRGDFASAARLLEEQEALAVREGDIGDQVQSLIDSAELALEMGDVARAGRDAEAFLERKQAMPPPTDRTQDSLYRDMTPMALRILRRARRISPEAARRERDAWLAQWEGHVPQVFLWLEGYVRPAETAADAEEALARRPADLTALVGDYLETAALGRVYLLAAKVDEALPLLAVAAAECAVRRFPLAIPQASYFLGVAREAKGDKRGACEAYGRVLARWGTAKPRSVTAGLAARHAHALGCES